MTVKLLTEQHLECLRLKGSCTDSPDATLVKMPHCRKSHVAAQIVSLSLLCTESTIQLNEEALKYYKAGSKQAICTNQQRKQYD